MSDTQSLAFSQEDSGPPTDHAEPTAFIQPMLSGNSIAHPTELSMGNSIEELHPPIGPIGKEAGQMFGPGLASQFDKKYGDPTKGDLFKGSIPPPPSAPHTHLPSHHCYYHCDANVHEGQARELLVTWRDCVPGRVPLGGGEALRPDWQWQQPKTKSQGVSLHSNHAIHPHNMRKTSPPPQRLHRTCSPYHGTGHSEYGVRLFDLQKKKWQVMNLDATVPCVVKSQAQSKVGERSTHQ
jgi:hypothetical protein